MAYEEFLPFNAESIEVKFACDHCSEEVTSEDISVPSPNLSAEKASDSHNENEGWAVCPNCDKSFEVLVSAGYASGYVEIDSLPDGSVINIIEHEFELDPYYEEQIEAILSTKDYSGLFLREMDNLSELNNLVVKSESAQKTLHRQVFSGVIGSLEDFLSSTIMEKVLKHDEYFKNFVRGFHDFRSQKFSLTEIYERLEQLENTVKKELVDVIYHNMGRVKNIYELSLKVDFPDIEDMSSLIQKRHDIVHRNGKNKDGVALKLEKEDVDIAIEKVVHFVTLLEAELDIKKRK